jgi:transcriptional regulator with XRE-family HTH domain
MTKDPRASWKVQMGKRLREEREAHELTQQAVADALSLSKQLISHHELGRSELTLWDLVRLRAKFNLDVSYIALGVHDGKATGARLRLPAGFHPHPNPTELLEIAHGKRDSSSIERRHQAFSAIKDGIVVDVVDRGLEPMLKPGGLAIFDRTKAPQPGDVALIVLLATDEILIRRYRPSPEARPAFPPYVLRADNPDFEPRSIVETHRPVMLGVLAERVEIGSR